MTCRTKKLAARVDAMNEVVEFALLGLRTDLLTCIELIDSDRPEEARELLLTQIEALDTGVCTDTVQ